MTTASLSTRPKSSTGGGVPAVWRRTRPRTSVTSHQNNEQDRRRTDVSERGSESENPVIPSPTPEVSRPRTNRDWWPNQLNLQVLHQHSPRSNPMGEDYDYAEEIKSLDVEALRRDVVAL